MEFAAEGLLDNLTEPERSARLALLERLAAEGVPLDELKAAVAEDRLALLPVERALGGRYTAAEIERQTGLPATTMLRNRRLLGLPEAGPEDRVFGEEDVAAGRSARLFLDIGMPDQAIAEFIRVLGEAMARLASITAATFTEAFLEPGDTEAEMADRFTVLAEALSPALAPVLVAAFKLHVRDAIRRGMITRAERQHGELRGSRELTVCFIDLVGFTGLGGELEPLELGTVATALAALAANATVDPVRLIKTIGDAVLLAGPDARTTVEIALGVLEAARAQGLPPLRAGIALGPALMRSGDLYGHTVNLASRITGIARPGSVLCTKPVHAATETDFAWSFAGCQQMKGVLEPVPLFRARHLQSPVPEQVADEVQGGVVS